MDRRSALALLATLGLTGCSFEPVTWVTAMPEPETTADPAVELRDDFFIQTSDAGVKSIDEGATLGLRVSTPYFDGRIEQLFLGEEVGAATAVQVRRRTPLRAPEGHQILAFTLAAGRPSFQADPDTQLVHSLRVGESLLELGPPFGRHTVSQEGEYDIDWTLVMLCVPTGQSVRYEVTDQDRTVAVDLIGKAPVDDEAWAATQGFRERHQISIGPERAIFSRGVVSQPDPALEIEAEATQLTVPMAPNPVGSILAPWLPGLGWAETGAQWLRLRFTFDPSFADTKFHYDLDVAQSFTFEDGKGTRYPASDPERLTVEDVDLLQQRLDVTFAVGGPEAGAMRFQPVGNLQALYTGGTAVPAVLTDQAPPLEFAVQFTAQET
ncbi:hypothetical protein [Tessaracoccus massiliensis]|nr:hypothetical protein [Tessaracoccus massiliensis]